MTFAVTVDGRCWLRASSVRLLPAVLTVRRPLDGVHCPVRCLLSAVWELAPVGGWARFLPTVSGAEVCGDGSVSLNRGRRRDSRVPPPPVPFPSHSHLIPSRLGR